MATTKTPQQIANLREALEVWWPSVPEANVYPNLFHFSRDGDCSTDCGTVACFGGWAARWPALKAQGARLDEWGIPAMTGGGERGLWVATALFGDSSLFQRRGDHRADANFTGSDHALVTNRLRWALEH